MKNKDIYLGMAAVAVTLLSIGMYRKYKSKQAMAMLPVVAAVPLPSETVAPFTISLTGDPTNGVYLVKDGNKYAFVSEKAFTAYGYIKPRMVDKAEFDKYPDKGWITDDGKIVVK